VRFFETLYVFFLLFLRGAIVVVVESMTDGAAMGQMAFQSSRAFLGGNLSCSHSIAYSWFFFLIEKSDVSHLTMYFFEFRAHSSPFSAWGLRRAVITLR
jgi:hypothetical protein